MCISIKRDLLLTSSSNSVGIRGMPHRRPHLIAPGFPSTPSRLQQMPMILQLNFVGRRLIKVSSEASVGWQRLHDLTWRRSTPFSPCITANPRRDTCVQLFLSFIISTRLMILASTSLRLLRIRFTRSFTFQTLRMSKPIRMLNHPLPLTYLLSRPTAMHVGAPKLVRPFGMALYFLYSRFEA